MREIFTYGSVGGAPGHRCFYLEIDPRARPIFRWLLKHLATHKLVAKLAGGQLISGVGLKKI